MTWKLEYSRQDFLKSISNLKIIVVVHLIIVLFYWMYANPFNFSRIAVISLTILIIILTQKIYNWKKFSINILIFISYELIVLFEYYSLGSISLGLPVRGGKGMLMDFLISLVPYMYLAFRIAMAFPILIIENQRRKLFKTEKLYLRN